MPKGMPPAMVPKADVHNVETASVAGPSSSASNQGKSAQVVATTPKVGDATGVYPSALDGRVKQLEDMLAFLANQQNTPITNSLPVMRPVVQQDLASPKGSATVSRPPRSEQRRAAKARRKLRTPVEKEAGRALHAKNVAAHAAAKLAKLAKSQVPVSAEKSVEAPAAKAADAAPSNPRVAPGKGKTKLVESATNVDRAIEDVKRASSPEQLALASARLAKLTAEWAPTARRETTKNPAAPSKEGATVNEKPSTSSPRQWGDMV